MANTIINNPDFDTVNSPYRASTEDLLYQLQLIAQGGGGGGGGDATSLNQSTQITLASALNSLIGVGNASTSTIASETTQTVAELVLIKAQEVIANTKLDQIITNTGTPVVGGATSANQLLELTALNQLISNTGVVGKIVLNDVYNQLISLNNVSANISQGVLSVNGARNLSVYNSTVNVWTETITFALYQTRIKYMTFQFETNVGATGTLDVKVKANNSNAYIRIPLIDRQALFAGAYINTPVNVAGAKMYTLDLTGVATVQVTPSVLSSSYNYSIYFHN